MEFNTNNIYELTCKGNCLDIENDLKILHISILYKINCRDDFWIFKIKNVSGDCNFQQYLWFKRINSPQRIRVTLL